MKQRTKQLLAWLGEKSQKYPFSISVPYEPLKIRPEHLDKEMNKFFAYCPLKELKVRVWLFSSQEDLDYFQAKYA
jgi:hypothetical protein